MLTTAEAKELFERAASITDRHGTRQVLSDGQPMSKYTVGAVEIMLLYPHTNSPYSLVEIRYHRPDAVYQIATVILDGPVVERTNRFVQAASVQEPTREQLNHYLQESGPAALAVLRQAMVLDDLASVCS